MIKITIVIFINPCSWMNSTMYKHGPKIAFLGCKQYAEVFGNAYCPKQNSWVSYIFIHFRVCRQLKWKRRQSSESATQKSSVIYFYSECIEKNDTVNNYTLIINYIGISWILIGFIASVFFFPCIFFYHIPFVHISQSQVDALFLSVRNDALQNATDFSNYYIAKK